VIAGGQAPAFGVGTNGLSGRIFTLGQHNQEGCEQVPEKDIPTGPWIALIARGSCHFVDKVITAQKANASAAIIFDNDPRPENVPIMCANTGDDADVAIPALAVSFADGQKLANHPNENAHLSKFEPYPNARCGQYFPFQWTALTVVIIAGAMLALCMGTLMAAIRRRRTGTLTFLEPLDAVLGRDPPQPIMNLTDVDELPSKIYIPLDESVSEGGDGDEAAEAAGAENQRSTSVSSSGSGAGSGSECGAGLEYREEQTCSICLDDFKAGQKQRLLPCSHVFHASCVDEWLTTRRAVCPICKQDPTKTTLSPRTTQTAAVETGADAETCVECDDATVSISIESTDDDDEAGGGGGGAATAEEMSLTVEALAMSSSSSSSTGTLSESLLGAEGGSAEITTL